MSEPRTIRAAREAIHGLEDDLRAVHMSPSMAVAPSSAAWYLRKARLALRQADRALAQADDPRLESLKALSPHLERHRRQRVRMRCTSCWSEQLRMPEDDQGCWMCSAPLERVGRLPKDAGEERA